LTIDHEIKKKTSWSWCKDNSQ